MNRDLAGDTHHHTHYFVAEHGQHRYYECRCGSRRNGRRTSTKHASLDVGWLAGADRPPRSRT